MHLDSHGKIEINRGDSLDAVSGCSPVRNPTGCEVVLTSPPGWRVIYDGEPDTYRLISSDGRDVFQGSATDALAALARRMANLVPAGFPTPVAVQAAPSRMPVPDWPGDPARPGLRPPPGADKPDHGKFAAFLRSVARRISSVPSAADRVWLAGILEGAAFFFDPEAKEFPDG